MEKYFVIGGSELQKDFIIRVKERGFEAHVFDYDANCIGKEFADVFHEISIDNKDLILSIAQKENPVAIHSVATELGNVTACYVAEKMGLIGNSYQLALATTDKALMKEVFVANDIGTPRSLVYKESDRINIEDVMFPCIVKPSDRSAGRGIKIVYNEQEFKEAVKESFDYSYNRTILVEEYFDAPQYSVETISFDGKHEVVAITEMTFSGSPYFVEHAHILPAPITDRLRNLIEKFAIETLKSFDIRIGACHVELRVKEEEIKIIEIASRMGGWRHWMINSALKYNYLDAIIDSTVGKECVQQKVDSNFVTISRHVVDHKEMGVYNRIKQDYPELIIIDYVNRTDTIFFAKNIIEAKGFYIILIKKEEIHSIFRKEEVKG